VTDLQWPLAAHLLHGLPFVEGKITKSDSIVQTAGNFFDLRTAAAKSAKASTLRAISGLVREGGLIATALPDNRHGVVRWGYVLTPRGLDVGHAYERPFAPALIWRAGLIVYPHEYGSLFAPLYAQLCTGALTLDHLIETFSALTPCPLGGWTTEDEYRQYCDWHAIHRQEVRTLTAALLGEDGLARLPPWARERVTA
jgi:hypothetical protein